MSTLPSPAPDDPVPLVSSWLAEIVSSNRLKNPNAMALATSDRAGAPSVRMVLLKEIAPAGYALFFYSNYQSRKGAELDAESARGRGALLGAARSSSALRRSRRALASRRERRILREPRPTLSQLNAWSSAQSRPLAEPAELERAAERSGAQARCRARRLGRASAAAARVLGRLPTLVRNRRALGRRRSSLSRAAALPARARARRRARLSPRPLERRASATVTERPLC